MIRYILLFLLLLPSCSFSQTKTYTNLGDYENRFITLALDWHYQKGDNLEWAQPDYDDSNWKTLSSANLNMPDSISAIAQDNEIAWFRKYIKLDSLSDNNVVLDIWQQGASEVYLDGKLIHKLGTVSTNPDQIEIYNPAGSFLALPLENEKEHVLAVRYVNAQYKYPKNERYTNTNGSIRLFSTSKSFANSKRTFAITDSTLTNTWEFNRRYWRYKKGDENEWANPNFDDSSWGQFSSSNLNRPDNNPIAGNNEIIWFRKPIKADSTLNDPIVFSVSQTGASEIYLDGVLIAKIGLISSNPEKAKAKNAYNKIFSLPLKKGKEQMLAIRYQRIQSTYPLYDEKVDGIALPITTLHNAISNGNAWDHHLEFKNKEREIRKNNINIVLGVGLFMSILFLCYFLFFIDEKINGYFALSSLFFTLFMAILLWDLNIYGYAFKIDFLVGLFSIAYELSILFCIYKILNRKIGTFFWIVVVIGLAAIPSQFLLSGSIVAPIMACLVLIEVLRISIKSLKSNRAAALTLLFFTIINFVFWLFLVLDKLAILSINSIDSYEPFAYTLVPLSIAIFLGYEFSKKSKSLRLRLVEVEKLSQEKEHILSTQNTTLERQVKERTASLNRSLEDLKATQSQLIQSEKMASLGELTAGIAHEIQNPLNFVNNFSEVSNELIDEMNEELDNGDIEEAKAISVDLKQNLEKINHHGKRADGIVKGMLQHSRSSNGEMEPTDINKLADEYLRLAYHGLRAKDKSFNATLETDFDDSIGNINVLPQDMGRVILNLITNAFYACNERQQNTKDGAFKPIVSVTTKKNKNSITIKVKDNGKGIPKDVVDKIFQPFFTTKPTGQGTGLGLSMSYDIVTKGHGGELKVETKEGEGTTFCINLPITK